MEKVKGPMPGTKQISTGRTTKHVGTCSACGPFQTEHFKRRDALREAVRHCALDHGYPYEGKS